MTDLSSSVSPRETEEQRNSPVRASVRSAASRRAGSPRKPQRDGAAPLSRVVFSSGKDDWQTPPELFAALDAEFGFDLDVAANADNWMVENYLGPDRGRPDRLDGLSVSWQWLTSRATPAVCWCNPPYSRGLQGKFIAKAASERRNGVTTVMLLPARTDTKAFHGHIWDAERHQPRDGIEVRFLKGRIKFVGAAHGAPFPSMIVVFKADQR